MRILTLCPTPQALRCALFEDGDRAPQWEGSNACDPAAETRRGCMAQQLTAVRRALASRTAHAAPDAIGVRVVHGGEVLDTPQRASTCLLDALQEIAHQAPLHVPATVDAVRACQEVFSDSPIWLVPDTGFFSRLPLREQLYGLDAATRRALGTRRSGHHGLLHQAACELVAKRRCRDGRRAPARVLSICLEPVPEIAAVHGHRPVMVTGGATPLEGLPGETTCGELDAGIVLTLARSFSLGPEQLDLLLSRQSGLRALAGVALTLGDILRCPSREVRLAREVLQYRVLLACGAGAGALGGLDALAFSGRYACDGETLVPRLRAALESALQAQPGPFDVHFLLDPLDRVLADVTRDAASRGHHARS